MYIIPAITLTLIILTITVEQSKGYGNTQYHSDSSDKDKGQLPDNNTLPLTN